MDEDIRAYRYDMEFCRDQLTSAPDITPQEVRTLQIRVLDCGHNIRHCQHRIAQLDAQAREAALAAANSNYGVAQSHRASTNHTPRSGSGVKRPRASKAADSDDDHTAEFDMLMDLDGSGTTSIQRLGFWKCRLCTSQKYLNAGASRVPSAPCKWPLKDVSKILNHCLDMHTEHTPQERCQELGAALSHNRKSLKSFLHRNLPYLLFPLAVATADKKLRHRWPIRVLVDPHPRSGVGRHGYNRPTDQHTAIRHTSRGLAASKQSSTCVSQHCVRNQTMSK